MKFFGHANLQKNQLQNAALQLSTQFPAAPVVGQVAFVNSIVYICTSNVSPPVWVPLTREITSYTYTRTIPLQSWPITHGLNTTSVSVQVFDSSNKLIIPDEIEVTGPNTVVVSFSNSQAGYAVIVTGHIDGNVRPTYAYTYPQDTPSDEWIIPHNLGYNPIVRVFIGTNEVQPDSITHAPNSMTTTITFSTPQVGYARLI